MARAFPPAPALWRVRLSLVLRLRCAPQGAGDSVPQQGEGDRVPRFLGYSFATFAPAEGRVRRRWLRPYVSGWGMASILAESHCVAVAEVFQPEDLIGDACGVEGPAGHMYFLSGVGCWRDYFWIQDVLS